MATEKYLRHSMVHDQTLGINSSSGFDCNICLESVHDPVVTICGHLYCWPCIYKWIHQHTVSSEKCPVCKSEISETTLIPLYGPGQSLTGSDQKDADLGSVIPDRPRRPSCGSHTLMATSSADIDLAGNSSFYSISYMFGEMMYARLFGGSQSFYTCPVSYGMVSVGSARARQHTLHADQSLSRRSFFLCCCLVLCLLLF